MTQIQQMLVKAQRVEVVIVLFKDDFYDLAMQPRLDPAIADLDECWQVVPQPGWTISADDEDKMTAHSSALYEPPEGWRYVATMALLLIPDPNSANGSCHGRGLWFAMTGVNPPPHMETFLAFLCDEMLRRAKAKSHRLEMN